MKKIVIIVDNPVRDLPSCTLVALSLVEKGYKVRLVSFDNAPADSLSFKPDYVLTNYARISNEPFLKRLQACRIPIGVMDTEGGVYAKPEGSETAPIVVKTFPRSKAVRDGVADYFLWGQNLYNYLASSNHFPAKILRLTGTPRVDVFHSKWTGPLPSKDLILINTSFTLANPKFRAAEAEARDLIEKFNFSEKKVMEDLVAQKAMLAEFINLTKDLALAFPSEKFVLRPHPFESQDPYIVALGSVENVEIRGDGTIDQWLFRSKALVHFECSTALEACLIDVPAFALAKNAQFRSVEVIAEVTDYCSSTTELVEKISAVLSHQYQPTADLKRRRERMINNIYFKFDGLSYQRITEFVATSVEMAASRRRVLAGFWSAFYQLRNIARRALGRPLVRKAKAFMLDDVHALTLRFKAAGEVNLVSRGHSVELSK